MSLKPVVAAAILDDSAPPRLLVARRSYPPDLAGLYELPGGKVERGEKATVALRREILEELGTEIVLGVPLPAPPEHAAQHAGANAEEPSFQPWAVGGGRPMWVWLASIAPGAPAPQPGDSHQDLAWVDFPALRSLPWIPADLPIVEDVVSFITNRGR